MSKIETLTIPNPCQIIFDYCIKCENLTSIGKHQKLIQAVIKSDMSEVRIMKEVQDSAPELIDYFIQKNQKNFLNTRKEIDAEHHVTFDVDNVEVIYFGTNLDITLN